MRVVRFGNTYSTAYEFSNVNAEEDWGVSRPPVQMPVGGAGGAFDFYGSEDYPIRPLTIEKRFTIVGDDYEDVEDELDDLRDALFAGLQRLWGERRSPGLFDYFGWAWAKCTNLVTNEKSGGSKTTVDCRVTFNCPEGIWYGNLVNKYYDGGDFPWSSIVTNLGNYSMLGVINVDFDGAPMTKFEFVNSTNGTSFTWEGSLDPGNDLNIDSHAYSVVDDAGNDEYRNVTLEDGQMSFIVFSPGANATQVTVTGPTGDILVTLNYYPTYLY